MKEHEDRLVACEFAFGGIIKLFEENDLLEPGYNFKIEHEIGGPTYICIPAKASDYFPWKEILETK